MLATENQGAASLPAKPPSLLSRIDVGSSDSMPMRSGSIPSRSLKRRASNEDEERPSKRRAAPNEISQEYYDSKAMTPWLKSAKELDENTSQEVRLHHELMDFVEYITPSEKERQGRAELVERITKIIQARWSDANVTLFGSSATGLELTGGDIDLVIAFDLNSKLSEQDKKRRLAAIGDLLRKAGLTTWVNRIFGARVPIIAFTTKQNLGEISIDISIRNDEDSGPRAIPVVKQYLHEMPALRTLIHAIKAFLSFRDLNDASQSTLSSYAITIMCISFLQRNPSRRPQSYFDDPLKEKAFGTLLMDFFRHYGQDFSYATHYISVTDKGIFSKKLKGWEPKGTAVLAVQCLLNPDNNVTRGCSRIGLIVEAFQQAHHALQATRSLPSEPSTLSLLSGIYELPEEMDSKRREIETSFDSGAFTLASQDSRVAQFSGTRALSGGVSLSGPSGTHDRDYARPPRVDRVPRTVHASPSSIQQLPPLHLGRDRGDLNAQFRFNCRPEVFSHINFSPPIHMGAMPFAVQQAPFYNSPQHHAYSNDHAQREYQRHGGRHAHGR